MNREFKKESLKDYKLPLKIDSFVATEYSGAEKYFKGYEIIYFTCPLEELGGGN